MRGQLFLPKVIGIVLGLASIGLALLDYDMLPLVFMTQSFYIPIVDIPLIAAILGFRTSTKVVLISMGTSFVSVIVWRTYFMDQTGVDSILPASAVSLVTFLLSHYTLNCKKKNDPQNLQKSS
jgi:ABC-type nitrate/sulfonate/bicarbonate transport system permease component